MARADELFAELFSELRRELAKAGIRISVTDGYRSIAEQMRVVQRKGLAAKGGLAAPPGRSFHNWGFALDVAISPQNWPLFGRIAESIGFKWGGRFKPRAEPWHIDLGSVLSIDEAREIFDRAYLVEVR